MGRPLVDPGRRISARPPREQIALGKPAAGTVPTAPDSTRRPDLDLPAFRRFSMITVRAGQAASHGSCTELSAVLLRPQRSPPPGRQHSNFTRQRRRESPNQPARIPVCTRGSWPTTDGGELAMAASAVLDKVLLAPQLSKAVHALAAPPLAYASMSALPSSFSRRCSCACAGISSMAQYSFTTAPRWLRGDLQVYDARRVQIAGGGAAQQGPNRHCARLAIVRVRSRRRT